MTPQDMQMIMMQFNNLEKKVNVLLQIASGNIKIPIAGVFKSGDNGEDSPLVVTGVEQSPNGIVIRVK